VAPVNESTNHRINTLAVAGFLALVTLASLWPLFHAGLFVSDEELHPLRRLSEFDFALRQGQWWPRWFPDLELGHGYPYPNFYAPGGLWLAELVYLFTRSYLWGVKGAYIAAGFLASFGTFAWLRLRFSRGPAVIGALLYLLAPYHTLNIYVRGNVAEYLAMGLIPWALWGLERLRRQGTAKNFCLSALLIAAFQLSHTLSAFFGSAILVILILLEAWIEREERPTAVLKMGSLATAALLTAIYWVPALWDSQFVKVTDVAETIVAADHVVYPWQFLDPRWGWGYSLPGPHDELSLQMGLPQFGALVLAMLALIRRRTEPRKMLVLLILCLGLILVMMPVFSWFWRLPAARMIQFPWRLLAWVAIATAYLGAAGVEAFGLHRRPVAFGTVTLICMTQFIYCRPEFYRDVNEAQFQPDFTRRFYPGNTTDDEYLPRWVLEKPRAPSAWSFQAANPATEITDVEGPPFHRQAQVVAAAPDLLRFDVYRFPNWRVTVDGHAAEHAVAAPDGTTLFRIPAGRHQVAVKWVSTLIDRIGIWVSAITLLALLGGLLWSARRRSAVPYSLADRHGG
jgi:hypothetical protein